MHDRSACAAGDARHSLRSPVTDENFYFVMADRFANGDTANDDGDYADWGLHMWGEAVDPAVLALIAWGTPWPRAGVDPATGWARYEIPLVDDTKPVNFIMHRPSGDSVPDTREPGGDRSFVPSTSPQVWIRQGDPTVYDSRPAP